MDKGPLFQSTSQVVLPFEINDSITVYVNIYEVGGIYFQEFSLGCLII